jgi:hypothetical protein
MTKIPVSLGWIKSSYSTGYNNCVIVRTPERNVVEVGDSKMDPIRALQFSSESFGKFIERFGV